MHGDTDADRDRVIGPDFQEPGYEQSEEYGRLIMLREGALRWVPVVLLGVGALGLLVYALRAE